MAAMPCVENTLKRVVHSHHQLGLLQPVHAHPGDDAGADADDDGAPPVDVAGGRRDRDQTRDHAVDRADDRRLAVGHLVAQGPQQHRARGGGVGVQHRGAGVGVGEVRVTAVEPIPAEPKDAAADQRDQQAVGREMLAVLLQARPDHGRGDEARRGGGKMDDVAAGEVDHPHAGEPSAAPQAERPNGIGQRHPQRAEDHPRHEAHAPEHRARQDDHRDRCEHELEVNQRCHRESQIGGMPAAAAGMVAWPILKAADSAGIGVPRNGNHCGPNAML